MLIEYTEGKYISTRSKMAIFYIPLRVPGTRGYQLRVNLTTEFGLGAHMRSTRDVGDIMNVIVSTGGFFLSLS
jgi:hypothetical protein